MTAESGRPRFSEATLAEYREILTRYPERRAALLPTLWLAQREFGWLSLPAQEYVAELMDIPLSWVTSVVSFYTMYLDRAERPAPPAGVREPVVRAARVGSSLPHDRAPPRARAGMLS